MTIRDRIFDKLDELGMTQKEFSSRTGIPQSTVSDWRKKKTNPTAEKIMIICEVLQVTPEWLLSGAENEGTRGNILDWYVIGRNTEIGQMIQIYHKCDRDQRARILGYMEAFRKKGT